MMNKRESKKLTSKARIIISVLVLTLFLTACGNDEVDGTTSEVSESNSIESYISTVKTGYLGEYTDITIGELLDAWYGIYYDETSWDEGTTDDGESIVEFQAQAKESLEPVHIQFVMHDNQIFKLCGYDDGTGNAYTAAEVASNLNYTYYNVRLLSLDSTDDEKMYEETLGMIEQFNGISGSAVLYGASADYKGDRSKLGEEFYEESPIEMTVTELLNYYFDDMFLYFSAGMTDTTNEWLYNVIPYSTYESGGDDLHLYINLVWNDDASIDLYGFGYSYGEVAKDYEVSVHLTPDPDYEYFYISDFRNFSVGVMDTFIGVTSDGDEAGHSFSGDFSLVTDGEEAFSGDVVELRYEEIPDFFRDTTNVNSIFKCNLYYNRFASYLGNDYQYLYYTDESGAYISFVIYGKVDDSKFFSGDLVTVTGVYTDQSDANADIVIDAISMELFN